MLKERRLYTRFSVEGNVVLKPEDGTLRVIKTDLDSICFLGVGVYTPQSIGVGINVKFELMTKLSSEPIIGEGKTVYANEIKKDDTCIFRMGINFINIDKKKIQHLLTLIQKDIVLRARKKKVILKNFRMK